MIDFISKLRSRDNRRKRLLSSVNDGPLKDFLSVPFPTPDTRLEEVSMLAVDFETTGLDPLSDKLLSVGYVSIEHLSIPVASAYHQLIRTDEALRAENVIIHQITDDAKDAGEALREVVGNLLGDLQGKVLLAHYHQIEERFLNQACQLLYGSEVVLPIVDTLHLQQRHWQRQGTSFAPSQLRLANLREYFRLPHHKAHNALTDALATAEVFLAQTARYRYQTLRDVLCH